MQRPSNAQDSSFHLTEKPRRRKCGISQKGAIKTWAAWNGRQHVYDFNTKKVRLKLNSICRGANRNAINFNTKKVRLKLGMMVDGQPHILISIPKRCD